MMVIAIPGTQRIFELLAFVVALYFPLAMLTWLVIDKFFVSSQGEARAVRRQTEGIRKPKILADHSQPEA